MKTGTKSLLFGVHQFILHPLLIVLAWRKWHGRWPKDGAEWVAILTHDWGYWGCAMMDSGLGAEHPAISARIAARFFKPGSPQRRKVIRLIKGHSRGFAKAHRLRVSALYAPDKLCVLYEWRWFYLLRALLSGEVWEYMSRSPCLSPWSWLTWYKAKTRERFYNPDGSKR